MADPVPPDVVELLRRAYAAFNGRDVDGVLATLHADVDWPNMIDGVRIHGHAAVRAYWANQFASIDPHVEPLGMTADASGRVVVDVHQVIHARDGGARLDDRTIQHVYTVRDGLVARMDVISAAPPESHPVVMQNNQPPAGAPVVMQNNQPPAGAPVVMQNNQSPPGAPVTSFAELLERMTGIDAALPATDGVACFNRMYRLVIESVQAHVAAGFFGDPAWMGRLDIVFANLYLSALPGSAATPPRAWAVLLDRRSDAHIAPLQFALAGMNAHINHDLPVAVCSTSEELGTSPDAGTHYADFVRVNTILAAAEPVIRKSFSDAILQTADHAVPGLQDVVANFSMVRARQTAWANATTLWALKQVSPTLEANFLDGLDHLVGFAGRGLLVPLPAL